jgi:NTP pyrophosphatase (non-canonical NTP hydrolase)
MFAIRDDEWAGLSKLVEECGEVLQVIGKIMGTRGHVDHWDGTDLAARLEEELGDLEAAVTFVLAHNWEHLDKDKIYARARDKMALFEEWHRATGQL